MIEGLATKETFKQKLLLLYITGALAGAEGADGGEDTTSGGAESSGEVPGRRSTDFLDANDARSKNGREDEKAGAGEPKVGADAAGADSAGADAAGADGADKVDAGKKRVLNV